MGGGVGSGLLATNSSFMQLSGPSLTNHTITASVMDYRINKSWKVTGVYDTLGDLEKRMFIRELKHLKHLAKLDWVILGDFNLIYKCDRTTSKMRDLSPKIISGDSR
jgi:hypothetical protein